MPPAGQKRRGVSHVLPKEVWSHEKAVCHRHPPLRLDPGQLLDGLLHPLLLLQPVPAGPGAHQRGDRPAAGPGGGLGFPPPALGGGPGGPAAPALPGAVCRGSGGDHGAVRRGAAPLSRKGGPGGAVSGAAGPPPPAGPSPLCPGDGLREQPGSPELRPGPGDGGHVLRPGLRPVRVGHRPGGAGGHPRAAPAGWGDAGGGGRPPSAGAARWGGTSPRPHSRRRTGGPF